MVLKKLKHALAHLLFWVAVLFLFTSVFSVDSAININVLYFSIFLMPVTIATTYVSVYKLIPEYLVTKNYYKFTLYSVYTFVISVFGIVFSIFYALAYLTNFEFSNITSISKSALFIITCVYLVVVVVSAFKLLQLNLKQSKNNAALETKILETQLKLKEQELNYLKMQIHPHFLFNTLNTLYGFALKKAEETPDMILKLSNLLDYLLYQVDKPFVSLNDEINHIEDYISLEKIRFNDTLNVSLQKSINSKHIEVAPMLLIPFVENSFKHGAIKNGILDINISIEANTSEVIFKIKNSSTTEAIKMNGIGLENIKKRLELAYPNQHQLTINNTETNFTVLLILNLKSKPANVQ
ncbi:MAG: histidine kinase [Winogradskyella sp.]|uniref:sensor histidine kinase n=1 Tax=Winogradskyella sp. TaxID=1883156 RepID=UPI0025DEA04D|nr:sensor histidine kinase [Winogradskyella sp.]NRB59153.1 histidine kinase [Winogradskyella sp.]